MNYFIIPVFVVLFFFLIMSILSIRSRAYFTFAINLLGLFVAGLGLRLEYFGAQTKLSLLVLGSLIFIILIFDFFKVSSLLIHEKKDNIKQRKIWQKKMSDRVSKMIFLDEIINEELNQIKDISMTEKNQVLQMWKLGNAAFIQNNYEDALEKYELSIKWCPTSSAWINKSGIYYEYSKFEDMVQCCDEAIKIDPKREESRINQGLAFDTINEPQKALKSFDEALAINSENPETFTWKGNVQRKIGKLDEALKSYTNAIDLESEFIHAWFHKGITLSMKNKFEEAIEYFKKALYLDPKFSPAHYNLANTLIKLDRNEEAISFYRKALKYKQEYPEAWNNIGIAQSRLGLLKNSIKSYQKAVDLKPDYPEAWLNRALASESLERYQDAVVAYKQFLEIAPSSLKKHHFIARNHLKDIEEKLKMNQNNKSSKKTDKKQKKNKKSKTENNASINDEENKNSSFIEIVGNTEE